MDVNKLIKLNNNDIVELLLSLDTNDKIKILKNEIFRNFLLSNFPLFTSVIDGLGKDLDYLCDDDFAHLIVASDIICISNLMMCSNENINQFLSKDIIIDYLYSNIEEIKYFLSSKTLNLDFVKRFFSILLSNDKTTIKYLIYFNEDMQDLIFNYKKGSSLEEKLEYNINNIDEVLGLLPNYLKLYQQTYDEDFLNDAQEFSKKHLISMIVDYFFHLKLYELKSKVKSILEYAFYGKSNISDYKLGIYSLLSNLEELDILEIKRLYKLLGDIDLENDYLETRNCCYKELNDSLFKGNVFDKTIDTHLSKIYGRTVCVLDGEEFFMLVHSTQTNREQGALPDMSNMTTYSCSLISDEHLLTHLDPSLNIILGYDSLDINNINSLYETKAFTQFQSKGIPRLYSPQQLIEKTRGYNELVYLDKEHSFRPSYIVCYDEIKIGDLEASDLLGNIPLVIINTAAYKKQNNMGIKK
ncbi:MAG: hypothetical protein HFH47_02000 [Bacilli bacterium]|nr:hypothetical protein [Bacilli bacterium]